MNLDNAVSKLCTEGTRAEFERRDEEARALYERAWEAVTNDYEACIAAHYVARVQDSPRETLRWNEEALARAKIAQASGDERVKAFFPSLYLSLGKAHETLADEEQAQHFYDLAEALGVAHRIP